MVDAHSSANALRSHPPPTYRDLVAARERLTLTVEGLTGMSTNSSGAGSLSRRATLKGAGLAVGTLWVAPLVQVISMDSAAAASAPPARVQTTTGGTTTVASGPVSDGELPQTGSSETVGIAVAGVAAVAVGAAAVMASRRMSSKEPVETDE
jgi:LPXTG-motif cell wall-anchored protein